MLSVLIVNWNTRDLLRDCLASLRKYPSQEPMEVIVVDNASTDGSAEMIRDEFPDVTLIKNSANVGYAKGNNLAFAAAKGEWLLTLNPDTRVLENTLQEAIERLQSYDRVGALGAKQITPTGDVQRSIRGFPTFMGILGDLTGLGKRAPGSSFDSYRLTNFDYESECEAPQPMGTFLLFKNEALAAVGDPKKPFDVQFPIFFNEVDLLYRMRLAEWGCVYAPSVRLVHLGGESTKQVRKSMIWESHRSLARFLRKHYRTPLNAAPLSALNGLIWLGALIRARGIHAGFRG